MIGRNYDYDRFDRGFHIYDIVRHFKGALYQIIAFAQHSETGEPLVVYQQLSEPFKVYCQPEGMFCSPVDTEDYLYADQYFRMEHYHITPHGGDNNA